MENFIRAKRPLRARAHPPVEILSNPPKLGQKVHIPRVSKGAYLLVSGDIGTY